MPGSRSRNSRSFETAKPWLAWTRIRGALMQERLDLGDQFPREIFQLLRVRGQARDDILHCRDIASPIV